MGITHVGVREVGEVLKFAVVTGDPWATLAPNACDVLLDANRDQQPDDVRFSYDLGAVFYGEYWGMPATFIDNLHTGALDADYFIPSPYGYNARGAVLSVDKESLGITGKTHFGFYVYSWGRDGGTPDVIGELSYHQDAPRFQANANEVRAPATLKQKGRPIDALVLYPFNAPAMQAETLPTK